MTNATITALVRAELARIEGRLNDAHEKEAIAHATWQARRGLVEDLQGRRADCIAFLHGHGEATPGEALKLQNVVQRVTWPGKEAGQEGGDS